MSFAEVRFNDSVIDYGMTGGPEFNTTVVAVASGYEQRNRNWSAARGRWQAGERTLTRSELDALTAFFLARAGRHQGFRFKDWTDCRVLAGAGRMGTGAVGTGAPAYQLYKRYSSGGIDYDRAILKPASGTCTFYRAAAILTVGAAPGNIAVDYTTGVVTFVADDSEAITGHTVGASHQFTTAADIPALSIGDKVYLAGLTVSGGTDVLNGAAHTISNKSGAGPYTWTIATTTTGRTVSGGTAYAYPQADEALTWAGEFDVPARFDADQFETRLDAYRSSDGEALYTLSSLPIVEIRL